jgi:four helix bundle protein
MSSAMGKSQAPSSKQCSSTNNSSSKPFDLEERTFLFAKQVRAFLKKLPGTIANIEDGRQLVRASGSVGANYREANESLGKKDFAMRIKISRKEAKESNFFLRLLDTGDDIELDRERCDLAQEAQELVKILSSIVNKSSS